MVEASPGPFARWQGQPRGNKDFASLISWHGRCPTLQLGDAIKRILRKLSDSISRREAAHGRKPLQRAYSLLLKREDTLNIYHEWSSDALQVSQ